MKKLTLITVFFALFAGMTMTQSCKKSTTTTTPAATLYDTLGGTKLVADPNNTGSMIEQGRLGIRSVVDSTIFVIAGDTAINGHFTVLLSEVTAGNLSGFQALSKNLTDFFCVATGAKDYSYGGKSMTDAHNPATNTRMNGKADNSDFTAFVNDLVKGAQKNGLTTAQINSVGALVGTLKTQVVQQ